MDVPFRKNAQGIAMILHGSLLLMIFLQTKPQKNKFIIIFDLYYAVILNYQMEEKVEVS